MHRISSFAPAAIVLTIAAAVPAHAQAGTQPPPAAVQAAAQPASIDSGMSRAQVVERLGKPAASSARGPFTYLFYGNGDAEKEAGTSDIVILENDKVIDAIFRSPLRSYTGTSSSPRALTPAEAAKGRTGVIKSGT
jgi:hypothetical protein